MSKIVAAGPLHQAFANTRYWCLLACAWLLSGCSVISIAYNNAPTAVNFYVDGYLDLDNAQETLLKERVAKIHVWHRSTQLTDYAALMGELRGKVDQPLTRADIAWLYTQVQARYRVTALKVVDDTHDLVAQLTPDNLKAMEAKFAKANEEYARDFINARPETIRRKRLARVRDNIEEWSGPLSDTQAARLEELVQRMPIGYALILDERKRRQQVLLSALRGAVNKTASRDETKARLASYVAEWEKGRSAAYEEWVSRFTPASHEMFAEMLNSMTREQRDNAKQRLQTYINEINALAQVRR
jgi:hypothetical protein